MAQTNFTPILTYKSDTASAVPSAGNLTNSANGAELAVNTADKRLFTKDSGGSVVELGTNPSSLTLPNGTANGVVYANGSKVLTTGTALTFDGTNLGLATSSVASLGSSIPTFELKGAITSRTGGVRLRSSDNSMDGSFYGAAGLFYFGTATNTDLAFTYGGSEQMRLTSTGLGIGTSSPGTKLDVVGAGTFKVDGSGSTTPLILRNNNTASTQVVKLAFDSNGAIKASINAAVYNNDYMTFNVGSDTERMRLDSSGNLGLGVTPSAWGNGVSLQGSAWALSTTLGFDCTALSTNARQTAYGGTDNWAYRGTATAALYTQRSGSHQWLTAPSGTAGNAISFTQAMTLDASGFLGVGETSPTSRIHANGTIQARTGATGVQIYGDGGSGYVNSVGSNPLIFQVNSTERARIDSSGNLIQSAPASPPALTTNGTMVFNLTSNTNLRVSVRGSDGVTRTANITLA